MWTDRYMLLSYQRAGKCFGLYARILSEQAGVDVDISAPSMVVAGARKVDALKGSDAWPEVAHREGDHLVFVNGPERPFDLVLVETLIGKGETARYIALHCGTVVEPGLMIDVEQEAGVRLREYRDVGSHRVTPALWGRVAGIYRAKALA